MAQAQTRHVVHATEGGWRVVDDDGETTGSGRRFDRKRDAEAFAKAAVSRAGGGAVVLHSPSGNITETDTVGAPDGQDAV